MGKETTNPSDAGSSARSGLLIGAVAERTGLSLRSVRYYEEAGLLTPTRTTGGFRVFDEEAVERLTVIMRMKPLGFSLDEMRVLLDLRDALAEATSAEERAALAEHLLGWQQLAKQKLATLREQVTVAEEFLGGLRADLSLWLAPEPERSDGSDVSE